MITCRKVIRALG